MPRFIPKIDLSNTSGSIPVGATSPGSKIKIDNESNNFIQIKFGVYGTDYLPPWTMDLFPLPDNIASIDYVISGTLSSSGSPDNSLYGVYYDQSEPTHGSFPVSTNRQSNIGNAVTTAATNEVRNDNNPAGTAVVEASQLLANNSNILIRNDGWLFVQKDDGINQAYLLRCYPTPPFVGDANVYIGDTTLLVHIDGTVVIQVQNWIAPTLLNAWVNFDAGTNQLAGYMKDPFGIVHLRGLVKSGTLPGTIFTLPVGYRPTAVEHFAGNAGNAFGALSVDASGNVAINTGVNTFVALNGITFKAA